MEDSKGDQWKARGEAVCQREQLSPLFFVSLLLLCNKDYKILAFTATNIYFTHGCVCQLRFGFSW